MTTRTYGDYRQRAIQAQMARRSASHQGVPSAQAALVSVPAVQPAVVPSAPAIEAAPVPPAMPPTPAWLVPAPPSAAALALAGVVETAPVGRFRRAGVLPAVAALPELVVGLTPATEAFLSGTNENTGVLPKGLWRAAMEVSRDDVPIAVHDSVLLQVPDQPKPLADATLDSLPIGHHPFEDLSGTAGVGKTTLVRKLLELSPKGSVVLAATTGIAAVNLGEGTTIHSLLGFFDTKDLREKFTSGRIQMMLRKHRAAGLRRIIIDEKSMLPAEALTCITRAVVEVNQPRSQSLEAVGQAVDDESPDDLPPQIALTLCGDFGQLPPVPDTDERTKKKLAVQFAFESPEWGRFAEHRTVLQKVWRQDDLHFITALHAVRRGDARSALEFFTRDRFVDFTDDQFDGTTIFAKNDEVDRHNQLRLDKLPAKPIRYDATRWGKQRGDWKQVPEQMVAKDNCLVMILANRRVVDEEESERRGQPIGALIYANGDLGTLHGINSDGAWKVLIRRTNRTETVQPVLREHTIPLEPGRRKELAELGQSHLIKPEEKQEIIGTIHYMPLRVAYACTCHKTQGLTLDQVQINIRDNFWQMPAMLFVGLSRARTAQGLRIVGNQVGFAERCRVEGRTIQWL